MLLRFACPGRFGNVHQAFDQTIDLHEDAKVGDAGHDAIDDVPDLVALLERLPVVGLKFLDRKRNAAVLLVDRRDHCLDVVPLLEDFGRMLDPLGP
jgi:hypothetical protein